MKKYLFVILFATITAKGFGQIVPSSFSYPNSVGLFGLCEISFRLPSTYSNPYDPDTINVYAVFTGPDNSSYTINAFYYEDYTFQQHSDGYETVQQDLQGKKFLSFQFPSHIRNLGKHTINNTLGDAVFVLIRSNQVPSQKK